MAAAVRSADLISLLWVLLNGLPLGAVPNLGGPDPVTFGISGLVWLVAFHHCR